MSGKYNDLIHMIQPCRCSRVGVHSMMNQVVCSQELNMLCQSIELVAIILFVDSMH